MSVDPRHHSTLSAPVPLLMLCRCRPTRQGFIRPRYRRLYRGSLHGRAL